jgi:hypothetical protein
MEEPGKQCTVVFALTVTEPASGCSPTSRPASEYLCKDDYALFSRFLYGKCDVPFLYRYDNGDVKVWDLRQMKECWETTVGRCLFFTQFLQQVGFM